MLLLNLHLLLHDCAHYIDWTMRLFLAKGAVFRRRAAFRLLCGLYLGQEGHSLIHGRRVLLRRNPLLKQLGVVEDVLDDLTRMLLLPGAGRGFLFQQDWFQCVRWLEEGHLGLTIAVNESLADPREGTTFQGRAGLAWSGCLQAW